MKKNQMPEEGKEVKEEDGGKDVMSDLAKIALFDVQVDHDLVPTGRIESMVSEPQEGNREYKLKLVHPSLERLEHLITQMNWRLKEGNGEAFYYLGVEDDGYPRGISDSNLLESIKTVKRMAHALVCDVLILKVLRGKEGKLAEVLVRKQLADFLDIRVCVIGNVDAGKSSLIGVLASGQLDDGCGSARMNVFRHRHEIEKGRTSSVCQQILGFDKEGGVTNYGSFRNSEWSEIIEDSTKVLTLIDLAGHERYFKTTVFGLTAQIPDYALVVVAANHGVSRMTRQHLGISFVLRIPIFIVITKVDICPKHVLNSTLRELESVIGKGCRHHARIIQTREQVEKAAKGLGVERVTPMFLCSCVTGEGLDTLKAFLNLLPKNNSFERAAQKPSHFTIDDSFTVPSVGTVVSGIILKGVIRPKDILLLGPSEHGRFREVEVKSIHVKRVPSDRAVAGIAASLALRRVKRSTIRKGMVLVDRSRKPQAVLRFEARIVALQQAISIQANYQPVVHVSTIQQAACIEEMRTGRRSRRSSRAGSRSGESTDSSEEDEIVTELRTGERALATFRFLHRPEFITPGMRLIFREGRTKGTGRVTRVLP